MSMALRPLPRCRSARSARRHFEIVQDQYARHRRDQRILLAQVKVFREDLPAERRPCRCRRAPGRKTFRSRVALRAGIV